MRDRPGAGKRKQGWPEYRQNKHPQDRSPRYTENNRKSGFHKPLPCLNIRKKFHGASKKRVPICPANAASSVFNISYSLFSPFISPLER